RNAPGILRWIWKKRKSSFALLKSTGDRSPFGIEAYRNLFRSVIQPHRSGIAIGKVVLRPAFKKIFQGIGIRRQRIAAARGCRDIPHIDLAVQRFSRHIKIIPPGIAVIAAGFDYKYMVTSPCHVSGILRGKDRPIAIWARSKIELWMWYNERSAIECQAVGTEIRTATKNPDRRSSRCTGILSRTGGEQVNCTTWLGNYTHCKVLRRNGIITLSQKAFFEYRIHRHFLNKGTKVEGRVVFVIPQGPIITDDQVVPSDTSKICLEALSWKCIMSIHINER